MNPAHGFALDFVLGGACVVPRGSSDSNSALELDVSCNDLRTELLAMSDLDLTFNVIDVETANSSWSSICQIGIVHVEKGMVVDEWQTLVDPEEAFAPINTTIHGISEESVRHSPTMPDIRPELQDRVKGSHLVSHSTFDPTSLKQCMEKYGFLPLEVRWIDTLLIARHVWPNLSSHNLKSVSDHLGISFNHHNALEDARATAEIAIRACRQHRSEIWSFHD